jgi:alanine racemase
MIYPSFNQVEVDPAALEHNYRLMCARNGTSGRVMAMVKSDGYGHGLKCAAEAFTRAGCEDFGVAEIGEAIALRESGCTGAIYVLLGFPSEQAEALFTHRLIPLLYNEADLRFLNGLAVSRNERVTIYLKFDCGMGRLGFAPEEAGKVVDLVRGLAQLEVAGIMSHYPCADDRSSNNSLEVFHLFTDVANRFAEYPELVRSICNSGGTLYFPESRGGMARAGIALYGYYPDGTAGREAASGEFLQPAMRFTSRVLQVKDVRKGYGIGYGHTFLAQNDMQLAVLPVGYSNGYFRSMSNRAEVLIKGQRAPVCGRICMNLCMVDISSIDDVEPGDEVVLLGEQGIERISGDDIGSWSGTISYEVLCSIGNNNQRTIVK